MVHGHRVFNEGIITRDVGEANPPVNSFITDDPTAQGIF